MSAPNFTPADARRICQEGDEWAAYFDATKDQPAIDMDDITRLRLAKHLHELCTLGRQAGLIHFGREVT